MTALSLRPASRTGLVAFAALWSTGCFLFETPCQRVSNSVCTVPGEEKSCVFLKDVARDNKPAQDLCTRIEPTAISYAKDPDAVLLKAKWVASRLLLGAVGFIGELTTETTRAKLDRAGEEAGEQLKKAGEELDKAAQKLGDAAGEAAKAIGTASEELTK